MTGEKIQLGLFTFNIIVGLICLAGLSHQALNVADSGIVNFIGPGLCGIFIAYCGSLAKEEIKKIKSQSALTKIYNLSRGMKE